MKLLGLKERAAFLRQSNCQKLPVIYNIKDINHRIQFMTDISAQHTGFQSSNDLINLTSHDFNCEAADFANDFEQYERMCIEQRSETLLLSRIHSAEGATISLICNKPFINDNGVIEGVEIWAQVLPENVNINKLVEAFQDPLLTNTLNQPLDEQGLSIREQECLYLLARGFTFLEIGERFCISPRTVESHITNIKKKLNVKTRAELIMRACELGYLQIKSHNPNVQPGKLELLSLTPCKEKLESEKS